MLLGYLTKSSGERDEGESAREREREQEATSFIREAMDMKCKLLSRPYYSKKHNKSMRVKMKANETSWWSN